MLPTYVTRHLSCHCNHFFLLSKFTVHNPSSYILKAAQYCFRPCFFFFSSSLELSLHRSMGKIISRMAKRFFQKSEMRIVMIGLDSSGKTTILYKMKMGQTVRTIPTIGFNVEIVEYKNVSLTVWDVGGQRKIRPLWKHYFQNIHGLIFAVDSSDRQRISEARNELHNILTDFELRSAMLLVFANKQDLPDSMSVHEMANKLDLHSLHHRCWYIQSTSAISGQGLCRGLDWLLNNISNGGL